VVEVDDDSVTIETTPGVKLRFVKNAIAGITSSPMLDEIPEDESLTDGDDETDAVDEPRDAVSAEFETDSAQEGDAADSSDDNVPAGESVLSASDKK
jgi:preprotein translocase subunit YajC